METFRVSATKNENLWKKTLGFEEKTSDRAYEEFAEFAGLGLAGKREQLSQAGFDSVKEGYIKRLNQYGYGINMIVSKESLKFKKYEEAIMGSESVQESLANTTEILAADVYANAFSTTLGLLPDGYPICSASHKTPRGGTFSTTLGSTSFSETGIEAALIQAEKMPGGHGIPVGVKPVGVVVSPENRFNAKRILKSEQQNWTANNAMNALKDENLSIGVNRFLASTSNWFLRTDAKLGLLCIWTERPNIMEVGADLVRGVVYSGNMMLALDCVNPRVLIGSSI